MIGGYRILQEACPRCRISRTAELGTSHVVFCFNCKLRVAVRVPTVIRTQQTCEYREPPPYEFSVSERLRLEAYRGAVRRGMYSDEITCEGGGSYEAAR